MTGQEMYKRVKDLMSEKGSSKVFDDYIITAINTVLGELFNDNNLCRMFYDKKPLPKIPQITDLDEELIYEDEYVYNVMPYGIAAQLETDDDLTKNGTFATKYTNAQIKAQKAVSQKKVELIKARED